MLKNILQKINIGLGLGLMCLLVSQGYSRTPPKPLSIQHLAFSNDSKQILYTDPSARPLTVNTVDAKTGKEVASQQLSSVGQKLLGFTPDGFKTAVLEPKGLSILHNKTGKVLRTLKVPSLPWPNQYAATQAITNKSGTAQLFHTANKRALNVIHTGNGRVLAELKLPAGTLRGMGISQDGRTISYVIDTSKTESGLYLYDTYQKKVTKRLGLPKLIGQYSAINTITFSPKGKYIVVQNTLVELATSEITTVSLNRLNTPAVFTPNERFLLINPSNNNQLLRVDLRSKQKKGVNLDFPSRCYASSAVDISPNGQFIAYGSSCPRVKGSLLFVSILNAADGSFMRKLTINEAQ
jgi:WD40 repeat protein